jgi:hypothetical protein
MTRTSEMLNSPAHAHAHAQANRPEFTEIKHVRGLTKPESRLCHHLVCAARACVHSQIDGQHRFFCLFFVFCSNAAAFRLLSGCFTVVLLLFYCGFTIPCMRIDGSKAFSILKAGTHTHTHEGRERGREGEREG